jgi:hypothetical protein
MSVGVVSTFTWCCNSPRLGQGLSSSDDETGSDSSTNSNHGNVAGLETTVQVAAFLMADDAIRVDNGLGGGPRGVLGLAVQLGVAVVRASALGGT